VSATSQRPGPKPLLGGGALILLIGAACVGLIVLLPFARERLNRAQSSQTSSLSLNYMELGLSKNPEDAELRRNLVKKLVEIGELARARETLQPLLDSAQPDLKAKLMELELDRGVWTAIPEAETEKRAQALRQVLKDVQAVAALDPSPEQQAQIAQLYLELNQPVLAAQVLDRLARVDLPDAEERVKAADDAWLAAGSPKNAADLHATCAAKGGEVGFVHARLAIARSQSTGDSDAIAEMIERMRSLYPQRLDLIELAAEVAEGYSVDRAFALAVELTRRAPNEPSYHRLVARLAEATGKQLRALDEYVWLVRHGGTPADRDRALELAKANWDLKLVRELKATPVKPKAAPRAKKSKATGPRTAAPESSRKPQPGSAAHALSASLRSARVERRHELQWAASAAELAWLRGARAERTRGRRVEVTWIRGAERERRRGLRICQAAAPAKPSRSTPVAGRLRALREDLALDEALGDSATVLRKLNRALAGDLAESQELWQRLLDLQLALGKRDDALGTAQKIAQRFPSNASLERVANMQLERGDARAALATLQSAPAPEPAKAAAYWMRLAGLAFEIGEVATERRAYENLTKLPGAAQWQYQRLWELAPDRAAALAIALQAFERYESEQMFYAALAIYREDENEAEMLALLERAEQYAGVRSRADYWQTRISLHQQRTSRALQDKDFALAKREHSRAATLIERAERRVTFEPKLRAAVVAAQSSQLLSIGLASDDQSLIARGYALQEHKLSVRERVYILQKMDRKDDALLLARSSLASSKLSEKDRSVLELDARALSTGQAQYVKLTGDALNMDGLAAWSSYATLQYSGRASGIRAEASLTQFQALATRFPVLNQDTRELSGALTGQYSRMSVELGVRAREEQNLRPYGSAKLQLSGEGDSGSFLRLHVNTNANDTAQLRAWGARDAVELQGAFPLGRRFYISARGLAEAYYTRFSRDFIGTGLSLDAGAGVSIDLPAKMGAMGFRVTGRVAPRFPKGDVPSAGSAAPNVMAFLPQSSEWAGVGASIGRGKLDAPPLIGRDFCYVVDGAAGWLWPQQGVGFSAQAGLGFSVIGADLLTVAARGGNVLGQTVWGANLGYGVTFDR